MGGLVIPPPYHPFNLSLGLYKWKVRLQTSPLLWTGLKVSKSHFLMCSEFAIRVDIKDDGDGEHLCDFLSKYGSYLVVEEYTDGNLHLHGYLRGSVTQKALRSKFLREFPSHTGNGAYSIKVCDHAEGYITYMCKGEDVDTPPVVVGSMGLDVDAVKYHIEYWATNAELKKRRRKKIKGSMVDQLLQRVRSKKLSSRHDISKEYIKMCLEANTGINVFSARAAVNTVACIQDESLIEELAGLIAYQS